MSLNEFPHHPALHFSTQDRGWNERVFSREHEKRFQKLTKMHALTVEWIRILKIERAPYLLERGLHSSVVENLWMLESICEKNLEDLLDDTFPDDVLGRLDYTLWAAQSQTLFNILENTPASDLTSVTHTLEQTAWRLGRKSGEEEWKELGKSARNDLPSLIKACLDPPFSRLGPVGFLVRRSVRNEVRLELLDCAHHQPYLEVGPVADRLCAIHSHWVRGYAYGINERTAMEFSLGNPAEGKRCEHRWSLITHPHS